MDEIKRGKRTSAAYKMLFTALLLIVCALIYIFTETSYDQTPDEPETAEESVESGVYVQAFCENAFPAGRYREIEPFLFQITDTCFESCPYVIVTAPGGMVKAFTLTVDLPVPPEEKEWETPIEARLAREKSEQYQREKDWIEENLTNMIRALDIQERLTHSDALYLLHTAEMVIENGKQQELSLAQFRARIYIDKAEKNDKLSVSLQDEKNMSENQK